MAQQEQSIFDFEACPHCGSDGQYYIRVRYAGKGIENYRFDNDMEQSDNTHLYDGLRVTWESKDYYCEHCHKKICKVGPNDTDTRMQLAQNTRGSCLNRR